MSGVNKIILLGRVGQNPEIKSLNSGSKVVSFSLATSEKYTKQSGEKVENTEWHNCEVWDKLADVIEKYVKKGDLIYLEGKSITDKWQTESGENRERKKVRGLQIQMLGGGNPAQAAHSQESSSNAPGNDDPLPF